MEKMCVHSCKGLCNALEVAQHHEQEAITEYKQFAATCDYPDVRELLQEIIAVRERTVEALRQKVDMLKVRFETMDNITESYT